MTVENGLPLVQSCRQPGGCKLGGLGREGSRQVAVCINQSARWLPLKPGGAAKV